LKKSIWGYSKGTEPEPPSGDYIIYTPKGDDDEKSVKIEVGVEYKI
jgi:hypothetical protein